MINTGQLREYVIRPTLQRIGLWSQAAENLVYGTGLVESAYTFLDQTTPGPGPAYGFWQMEEATHNDLWANYLKYQHELRDVLLVMSGQGGLLVPPVTTLHGNMFYAAAMCRVHYRRVQKALPAADDAAGLAAYWKEFYNTPLGAGTIAKATPKFQQAVMA